MLFLYTGTCLVCVPLFERIALIIKWGECTCIFDKNILYRIVKI
jgi:hypothetical protein